MSFGLRRAVGMVVGGALVGASLAPGVAQAEESSPRGKGIAGGALLGAELVMVIEAAVDVNKPRSYALGAMAGAVLGGVGGYFVEQNVDTARVPSYLLAAGVAFLVPAVVMAFNATTYKPPSDYQEDKGASGSEPVADAPQPQGGGPTQAPAPPTPTTPPPGGGNATPPAQGPQAQAPASSPRYLYRRRSLAAPQLTLPTSMVELGGAGMRVGVPVVEVRPVFSQQEIRQYGMAQREEVRIPVFQARFLASTDADAPKASCAPGHGR